MKNNLFPNKIVIIGVGLIGGSIALGLKKYMGARIEILGSCSTRRRSLLAKKRHFIDTVFRWDPVQLRGVELIILATPVATAIGMLKTLNGIISGNCIVMDVGSTKGIICSKAESLKLPFVGTHPMIGGEFAGFENANPYLFNNKPWLIIKTHQKRQLIIKQLIKILGGNMIFIDPDQHDFLVSRSSHIFLSITSVLVNVLSRDPRWRDIARTASLGYRDTTRLASFDPVMKKDILMTNKLNILDILEKVKAEIAIFSDILKEENEVKLMEYLRRSKSVRDNWLTNNFN